MIAFYNSTPHDINRFLKVWTFVQPIDEQKGLDIRTQRTLELTATAQQRYQCCCSCHAGLLIDIYSKAKGRQTASYGRKQLSNPIIRNFFIAYLHEFTKQRTTAYLPKPKRNDQMQQ